MTVGDKRYVLDPPRDIASTVSKTFFAWLHDLAAAYNGLAADSAGTNDTLIGYPTQSSQGIKRDYAVRLERNFFAGFYIQLPEDYLPGSTEFYWDRRRYIRKTDQTEAAGFYDYHEGAGSNGKHNRVWLDNGLQKGSKINILYTPAVQ